ncbi:MAG: hypothetical protein R3C42_01175 [Parvularculaceae bacterium]
MQNIRMTIIDKRTQCIAALALAFFPGVAIAETATVIASTSDNYSKGDVVSDGDELSLDDSELIVLLTENGEVVTISESGAVELPNSTSSTRRLEVVSALVRDVKSEELGATRGVDAPECADLFALGDLESLEREAVGRPDCAAAAKSQIENILAKSIPFSIVGRRAGETQALVFSSTKDAVVSCDTKSRRWLQGASAIRPFLVSASAKNVLTAAESKDRSVSCLALENAVWRASGSAVLESERALKGSSKYRRWLLKNKIDHIAFVVTK